MGDEKKNVGELLNDYLRRRKVLCVDRDVLMTLMFSESHIVLENGDFPKDAKVMEVAYDFARAGFSVLICHESFPVVPPGAMSPVVGITGQDVNMIERCELCGVLTGECVCE